MVQNLQQSLYLQVQCQLPLLMFQATAVGDDQGELQASFTIEDLLLKSWRPQLSIGDQSRNALYTASLASGPVQVMCGTLDAKTVY